MLTIAQQINNLFWLYIERQKELNRVKRKKRERLRMIRQAELRHQSDGKRYYVLPDASGKLYALNSSEINHLKKIGIMGKDVDFVSLLKEAVYYTK